MGSGSWRQYAQLGERMSVFSWSGEVELSATRLQAAVAHVVGWIQAGAGAGAMLRGGMRDRAAMGKGRAGEMQRVCGVGWMARWLQCRCEENLHQKRPTQRALDGARAPSRCPPGRQAVHIKMGPTV